MDQDVKTNKQQKKEKQRKFKKKPCIFIRSQKVKSLTLIIQKYNWALCSSVIPAAQEAGTGGLLEPMQGPLDQHREMLRKKNHKE